MGWKETTLGQIADADDLKVSPFRDDGVTCGTPTCATTSRGSRLKHEKQTGR